jgi:hypothetical protein
MEELLTLRRYIEQQRYTEALDLLAEMKVDRATIEQQALQLIIVHQEGYV